MGIIRSAYEWLVGPKIDTENREPYIEGCNEAPGLFIKLVAINTAINLISDTLSLSEYKTFENGKEVRKNSHYLFNVEPNINQNAPRFWQKLISQMVYQNQALVIMQDDGLFIADEFTREVYAFKENIYKNIVIEDFPVRRTFREGQVFYLQMNSASMKSLIDGLYKDYGTLIEYAKQNYKRSNARRGILNIPISYPQTRDAQDKLTELVGVNMKKFFNSETGAVLPLTNGIQYEDLTNTTYKNGSDSRDIRHLIDDIFDYVAIAFHIPPQMLKGTIAESDKTWDAYMTQCIKPITEKLEKEINRKYYGKQAFLEKTYMRIDTSLIRSTDIKDLATAIDILTRNGVNTLDDNLRMLGREEVGGTLGQTRFTTLNLTTMEMALQGGDTKDEQTTNIQEN